ncbi:hypothetical protein BDR04DRAFT_867539 [Suillus decipiens]|nr:hypothetical protein BDR04DRAFT_867539 [Suillus decipiens]
MNFPDGSSVVQNARMNKRAGFQGNYLILATHKSIPSSVLEKWARLKGKSKMSRAQSLSPDLSDDHNDNKTESIVSYDSESDTTSGSLASSSDSELSLPSESPWRIKSY